MNENKTKKCKNEKPPKRREENERILIVRVNHYVLVCDRMCVWEGCESERAGVPGWLLQISVINNNKHDNVMMMMIIMIYGLEMRSHQTNAEFLFLSLFQTTIYVKMCVLFAFSFSLFLLSFIYLFLT